MQEADVEFQDCLQPGKSQQDVKDLHGFNLLAIFLFKKHRETTTSIIHAKKGLIISSTIVIPWL